MYCIRTMCKNCRKNFDFFKHGCKIRLLSNIKLYINTRSMSTDINNSDLHKYLDCLRKEFYNLEINAFSNRINDTRVKKLSGVVELVERYNLLRHNLISRADIEIETDVEMRILLEEENEVYSKLMFQTEEDLINKLFEYIDTDSYSSLTFEINAGAGGQEAMLFAKELFNMYTNYFRFNRWNYYILKEDKTEIGGLRHANVLVDSSKAYNILCYEAGVHRVQRVPFTEKSGRLHTSTASITVLPRPIDVDVVIDDRDLKIETKRASGAGGQHVNTTDSAVRIVHIPTGMSVENQSERSQIKNREIAIKRLQSKLIELKTMQIEKDIQKTRKFQQGNLNRNEKIRTYNFLQDRITDHRFNNGTVHGIQKVLDGGCYLDQLIQRIVLENRKLKLAKIIQSWVEQTSKQN